MLSRDSEDEIWSRFAFELVIWTQPSGPLCLWQCFNITPLLLLPSAMWYKASSYSTLFMPPPARPNIELCLLTASFIQCHTKETCPLFKTDVNQHWMRCRTRNTLPPWITPTKPFYQLQQKPEHNDNDTHLVILWHCWKFIKKNRETQIMTTTRVIWHSDSDTGPTASQFLQYFYRLQKKYFLLTARWLWTLCHWPRGFTCGRGCARCPAQTS